MDVKSAGECSTYTTKWMILSPFQLFPTSTLYLVFTLFKWYHSTVLYIGLTRARVAGRSPAHLVMQGLPLVALIGREVCL